jgi:4-phospho-D-threonate 3-dehydrogenase / 4-phospho-D-erythronate 3-dehydrogenase
VTGTVDGHTATVAPPPVVVADDLTGAAEVAGAIGLGTQVLLWPTGAASLNAAGNGFVVDANTRSLQPAEASARMELLVERFDPTVALVLKVDSLLRGPLVALVGAVATAERVVVVAPALPGLARTTVGGAVRLAGVPLAETDAWGAEPSPPPSSVAAALPGLDCVSLGLDRVRGEDLAADLEALRGRIAVCDAETLDDLTRIAAATRRVLPAAAVGASALCRAFFGPPNSAADPRPPSPRPCLVVAGTAVAAVADQVAVFVRETGALDITIAALELMEASQEQLTGWREKLEMGLTRGDVVLRFGDRPRDRGRVEAAAALASLVASCTRVASGAADLILTGGQTARSTLDALGVSRLTIVTEVRPGMIVSELPSGALVGTRPGSFGGPDSLLELRLAMDPMHAQHDEEQSMIPKNAKRLPVIAVTMGDGAGVGPECTVGALLDEEVLGKCIPVVIGDAGRLRQAADALGVRAEIVPIKRVGDARSAPRRINVIDLGLLPADLPWGRLSAVAGEAAYQYVRVAAELALAGEVQAICTGPLNKEALHLAGHPFPGHTELLAHLTGTPEVSMMLTSPTLRVIHVTTHIGLIDAVAMIEPGLVERVVRRGRDALTRAGIDQPRIGVCAINPHAGEGGLFGHREEETKIIPALEHLRADGIPVDGPLPADTAFYLAGRGDYDLIVAMYHDQGHGPAKVLGIEKGVNITVGLPVIRTSVDHGTAFDIAGKGIVRIESMIEAMLQAVALAGDPGEDG